MAKFRMKSVSCASAEPLTAHNVCMISSQLASHLSVVSAVMDGTHLNTSQLVCSLLWKIYLGTKLHFLCALGLLVSLLVLF